MTTIVKSVLTQRTLELESGIRGDVNVAVRDREGGDRMLGLTVNRRELLKALGADPDSENVLDRLRGIMNDMSVSSTEMHNRLRAALFPFEFPTEFGAKVIGRMGSRVVTFIRVDAQGYGSAEFTWIGSDHMPYSTQFIRNNYKELEVVK